MFTVCMCVQCVTCVDVCACCVPLHVVVGLHVHIFNIKVPTRPPSVSIANASGFYEYLHKRLWDVTLSLSVNGVCIVFMVFVVCDVCVHVIVCVWVIHML